MDIPRKSVSLSCTIYPKTGSKLSCGIIFRVAAGRISGLGHLSRFIILATALVREGKSCHFLPNVTDGRIHHLAEQHGGRLHSLPEDANPSE